MITGYFMISSSFKLHKFGKLVGQIWFYSLALLPIGSMSWFAQTFLVLYILTPVINRLLHWLQHRYYLILLAASTVIWFVIPTALNLWPNLPHTSFGFKHIFSFIVFYSMGAYIKLDGSSIKLCSSYITQKTGIILSTYQYYASSLLPLYAVLMVAFIFIIGMCVDYLRIAFIEKSVMKHITSYIESSQS